MPGYDLRMSHKMCVSVSELIEHPDRVSELRETFGHSYSDCRCIVLCPVVPIKSTVHRPGHRAIGNKVVTFTSMTTR